jgi:hypothetical protein
MSTLLSQPEVIRNALELGLGSVIKGYYLTGDPLKIPVANMPAVICLLESSSDDTGPTSQDLNSHTTIIKVVYNKKDDIGASPTQDMTREKIRRLIEDRDGVTKQYLPNTILGILRADYTFTGRFVLQSISTKYDISIRLGMEDMTEEAEITVRTKEYITISNRV